ncbi:reverse transcriptase/maturase family protein [Stieleria sp. JC731]|uniref:reverse transcriptase/maturase family protein n=1 Tax=Pirellulaceae TaxID=2691357 RepID=UPI001E5C3769|nr:reverse transcriptase/maturase family protein [Stieleria sp. JC731]MCC9601922.1 reverse transcriptase/maturase family protein [Stieleria sp. JC731]
MKRVGYVIPEIATYENLLLAFRRAAKGKRHRGAVKQFSRGLSSKLHQMADEIKNDTVTVGNYTRFIIGDPKVRVIHSPCFQERVLHHAIVNVVGPVLERGANQASFACRKGKGNLLAIRFAQRYLRGNTFWMKLDIAKFFDSIDHEILKSNLAKQFKDKQFLNLMGRIVDAYETVPKHGLPIGALVSQYLANFTLDPLDRFVKEVLRCKPYVRFMDDFLFFGDEEYRLRDWQEQICGWLFQQTGLRLKESSRLGRSAEGVPFLGYRIKPDRIYLSKRSRQRFRRRHIENEQEYSMGVLEMADLQRRTDALLAFTDHSSCLDWRRATLAEVDSSIEN